MDEEMKGIFREATISAENPKESPESDRELLIFGEGDGEFSKKKDIKYKRPRFWLYLIAGLVGVLIGVFGTLVIVSRIAGSGGSESKGLFSGLSNLRLIRAMGDYDSSLISELLQRIDMSHFGDTPSSQELVEAAAHALVKSMGDNYARYYTVKEYEDYNTSSNGQYFGVGIVICAPDGTGALIARVYEDSFADLAGLERGDLVIAVDGVDVKNVSSDELVERITGDEGTSVKITFIRNGEEQTVTVNRGEVYVKRVDHFVLESGVGYLYLSSFTGKAVQEFADALEDFRDKGVTKVIVDLRNNGGGYLNTVVDICDMLLPECTICTMQGKSSDETEYYSSDAEMFDFELVVLVNENSASASEIFAGAIQDNGRGKIVGVQTYGKGVVQTTYKLEKNHGWIKLTTDAYFTPNGTNLGGTGITPDVVIDLPDELKAYDIYYIYTDYMEYDAQLAAALELFDK